MKDNRMKDALERIARQDVPENIDLWPRIAARLDRRNSLAYAFRTKPILIVLVIILIILLFTGVAYAVSRMFGFIPGIGIVEQGAPLRVLADPVSQTRDGITLTVEQVILGADKTVVIYNVDGISTNAYPKRQDVVGCRDSAEMRLQDGTTLQFSSSEGGGWGTGYRSKIVFSAIPTSVNKATFILPCISGTLAGVLPEKWELQISFVPAPPDLTVIPVIEVSPSTGSSKNTPHALPQPLVLEKVIETQDGYILIGKFISSELPSNVTTLAPFAQLKITDANGRNVFAAIPKDVDTSSNKMNETIWAYEIKGKQQAWPLTITMDAVSAGLSAGDEAKIEFDTGPSPQVNQDWILNTDLVSNGYHVTLFSIHRLADGYEFNLKADLHVTGVGIRIEGSNVAGGGGGGDGKGNFNESNVYQGKVPTGKLTLVVSVQSILIRGPWSITWQPNAVSTAMPTATPLLLNNICLTDGTLPKVTPPPADLTGKVLLYELLDGANWGIDLVSLDGSQKQIIASQGNWSTLSPVGTHVVYSGPDGKIHIIDISTGENKVFEGAGGYNPRVSLDGQRVAYVDNGRLHIINLDGSGARQIPINALTFSLAGWSPDGTNVYIAASGANGFIFQAVDVRTGAVKDLFTLEDSSRKAPDATVSPDGQWAAYRDTTNSRLYLVRIDGSESHLVIDGSANGISSIVWSANSKWLGVSLANLNSDVRTVMIVQPESCEIFILPRLHGEIQGLVLP